MPEQPVPGIDDMPNLLERLGKAKADRVRFHCLDRKNIGSKRTRWIDNPLQEYLDNLTPNAGGPIDDILSGICSLATDNEVRMSAARLHTLLACNKSLSTDLIAAGLNVDARQARRYLAAAKLAIFHIQRHRTKHD